MDRRKFLKGSGAALVGVATLRGQRLFGEPDSVKPKPSVAPHLLKLHLRQAPCPDEAFNYCGALATLARDVVADPSSAAAFAKDPSGYLAAAGFPHLQVDRESREFRLVLALADPKVRAAAASGDPILFLDAIRPLGFDTGDKDILACHREYSPQSSRVWAVVLLVVVGAIAIALVAVAVAVIAVVWVEVAAESLEQSPEVAQLAGALGGKSFAEDVVKAAARNQADALIRAIENGTLPLPPSVSKEEVIEEIELALRRHTP